MIDLQNIFAPGDIMILTTVDLRGKPKSRPLLVIPMNKKETLCFFTNEFFGKTNEIVENPLVCLSYSKPETETYLSIIGQASISIEPQPMEVFWNPVFITWFPERLATPNLALLTIAIEEIESWDKDSNKMRKLLGPKSRRFFFH